MRALEPQKKTKTLFPFVETAIKLEVVDCVFDGKNSIGNIKKTHWVSSVNFLRTAIFDGLSLYWLSKRVKIPNREDVSHFF